MPLDTRTLSSFVTRGTAAFALASGLVVAQSEPSPTSRATKIAKPAWSKLQQRGLDFLMGKQKDGKWRVPAGRGGKLVADPGISALCLAALAAKPRELRTKTETQSLEQGIDFLLASQKRSKDGAFSSRVPSYVTCAAILALVRADTGRKDVASALAKAQRYLVRIQNIEQAGIQASHRDYGSTGYGAKSRGDLSNTQMAIEALRATGLDVQNESFAKALVFLRRLQNLPGKGSHRGPQTIEVEGESKRVEAVPGTDGGAVYYPGTSAAGYDETEDGKYVPRSYGSMTYALLKCYILCGLPKTDKRLQAALNWCLSNYTLDRNPGVKKSLGEKEQYQGLFYYYLTLARALRLAEVDKVNDRSWRDDLRAKLDSMQKDDGSWINAKNGRWWENNPLLCTAYAILALSE